MASEIPMPSALTEEAVMLWLYDNRVASTYADLSRAVLALVEAKVREAVAETLIARTEAGATVDTVVARVMEKEAPRAE